MAGVAPVPGALEGFDGGSPAGDRGLEISDGLLVHAARTEQRRRGARNGLGHAGTSLRVVDDLARLVVRAGLGQVSAGPRERGHDRSIDLCELHRLELARQGFDAVVMAEPSFGPN